MAGPGKHEPNITCFCPQNLVKSTQFPLILFGGSLRTLTHEYFAVNSLVPLADVKKPLRQRARVIGFVDTVDSSFNPNHFQSSHRATFKFQLTLQNDHSVTGSMFKQGPSRDNEPLRPVQTVLFDASEIKYLHLRQKFDTPDVNYNYHFPQFVGKLLFVSRESLLLPSPYVDLRQVAIEETKESAESTALILRTSLTIAQIHRRVSQVKYLYNNRKSSLLTVKFGDVLSSLLFDIALGIVITYFLVLRPHTLNYVEITSEFAYGFISQLEQIVNDLMKMPVGLKLNRPLNMALGHFFLYHIYLLRTYLYLMRPIYISLIQILSYIGLLGFSFILTVLCDIFSHATVHAYCFYGYAVHIYSFNVKSLIFLWRLFRGKKWNPLKSRVDSFPYQTDQLLIGCLCFTILLFLLPTVLIYYCVFLVLRLLTLSVPLTLGLVVNLVTYFPAFSILLRTVNSKKVSSSVLIEKRENTFYLVTSRASIFSICNSAYSSILIPAPGAVTMLLKNIVKGDLITINYTTKATLPLG